MAVLAVEFDARVMDCVWCLVVCHQQRILDRLDYDVKGQVLLVFQCAQRSHIDFHVRLPSC